MLRPVVRILLHRPWCIPSSRFDRHTDKLVYALQHQLLLDRSYVVSARVAAFGQSPKTEYFWFDSSARDEHGVVVATMRMMLRFMKASSSLYGDPAPA